LIKEYSWKTKGFISADANKIGKELEIIEQSKELNAQAVVDYARTHIDSELYSVFDWDDSSAAEKYRRGVASTVISTIRVEIIEDDKKKTNKPIKAFVQTTRLQNYEPIEVVVKDVDKYQLLLEKAYRELNSIKDKYTELEEIQELLADIPVYD
jgi:hypothetical protein